MGRLMGTLALALTLLMLLETTAEARESWVGYVCKIRDFVECENGKKQIFPGPEKYSDKETCYIEFEKLLEVDKQMAKLYPTTNDPSTDYFFGCVRED